MIDRRAAARYFRPLGTTVATALLLAPLLTSPLAQAQQPAAAPVAATSAATAAASETTTGRAPAPALPPASTTPPAATAPVAALPGDAATPTTPAAPAAASAPPTTTAQPTTTAPASAPLRHPPQVAMPASNGPGFAGLLQTIFALLLVLGLLIGLAWLLKRYGPKAGTGTANLRVVGALNIGGRERIMVVEVGDQWIVVGAAPGRVNALHTMPRQDGELTASAAQGGIPATRFADWLKHTMDKRNAT